MLAMVTGGTGFVGANLVRTLLASEIRVRALVREGSDCRNLNGLAVETAVGDLNDPASLDRAVAGCDVVFHAAAAYIFWTRNPTAIYATNVQGTENILRASMRAGVRKIVYTSSETTIGIAAHELGTEAKTTSMNNLAGAYKRSKLRAEQRVLELCKQGVPVVIVNPTMPMGPWDVKPTPTGQVVVDFLNGRMPAFVNTGLNVVDVRDVAAGHLLALEHGRVGERYILGNRNLTLEQLLGLLADVSGRKAPRTRIPIGVALAAAYVDETIRGRLFGIPPRIPIAAVKTARKFRHFDCSKAINELGLPQTPIERALEDAVAWFTQHGHVRMPS